MSKTDWAPSRERWPASCTPTRDGWVRWYKGRTVFVAGRKVPLGEVEDKWIAKKRDIDAVERGDALPARTVDITYRAALSDFLAAMKHRVTSGKPRPMAERTYHNYVVVLNAFGKHVHDRQKIADMDLADVNTPNVLGGYAHTFGQWKASGFDSIISRVGALFNWAVEMEYLDRFRPGPQFQRPAKREIRDQRIDLAKCFTSDQVCKLFCTANPTVRCWIVLGALAAFNNSDIGNLTRGVVDLDTGVIDYRRRKTGKVRRVIPLPPFVVELLRGYDRPEPLNVEDADLFFISERGNAYSRTRKRDGKPSCSVSRLFRKLCAAAGVTTAKGQNFSGLRTTFYNLCPVGYSDEREIILGHAKGTISHDHYFESVGMERLSHVTGHIWSLVSSSRLDANPSKPAAASPSAVPQLVVRPGRRARRSQSPTIAL
jgi:hypothetical protein